MNGGDGAAPLLRRGLLALAVLTTVALGIELAAERHWTQPSQLVAWAALAILLIAVGLLLGEATSGRVQAARLLAVLVVVSGMVASGSTSSRTTTPASLIKCTRHAGRRSLKRHGGGWRSPRRSVRRRRSRRARWRRPARVCCSRRSVTRRAGRRRSVMHA